METAQRRRRWPLRPRAGRHPEAGTSLASAVAAVGAKVTKGRRRAGVDFLNVDGIHVQDDPLSVDSVDPDTMIDSPR